MRTHFSGQHDSSADGINHHTNGVATNGVRCENDLAASAATNETCDANERESGTDSGVKTSAIRDSSEFLADGPITNAIRKLARAQQFSVDCDRSKWDFAVEIADLDSLGVSHDEMRWLIGKGLVEHAREITDRDGIGRSFDSPGGFTFSAQSCFVATATGLQLAEEIALESTDETLALQVARARHRTGESGSQVQPDATQPVWDDQRHELRIGNVLVKRFKWRASNQEAILSAFEEDGWPARIDDPLSPVPETDPKRRLSDTIKCLNRKQQNSLIRFSGDGTGEGVLWDLIDINDPSSGR